MGADIQFERDLVLARRLQIGECRLDRALNEVHDGGRCTRVMPKAAAVLEVLIHFAGQPVSKERLLLEVWRGEFPTEDVVTNAISQLRKAFGDDARESRYIRTVPRVGYVLLADVEPVLEDMSAGELVEPPLDAIVAAPADGTVGSSTEAIHAMPLEVVPSPAPARRPLRALHAWVVLFLILLALVIGILIGGTRWHAAQAPHHMVSLSEQSASKRVTYRHATFVSQRVITFSWGFCRDSAWHAPRCSAHQQRTRGSAWT